MIITRWIEVSQSESSSGILLEVCDAFLPHPSKLLNHSFNLYISINIHFWHRNLPIWTELSDSSLPSFRSPQDGSTEPLQRPATPHPRQAAHLRSANHGSARGLDLVRGRNHGAAGGTTGDTGRPRCRWGRKAQQRETQRGSTGQSKTL